MSPSSPSILLIQTQPENLADRLQKIFGESVQIRASTTGLSGLDAYQQHHPFIVLVDSELPDLSGMSVATILSDIENAPHRLIYLLVHGPLLEHTRADRYVLADTPHDILLQQIQTDVNQMIGQKTSESYQDAVQMQNDMLPRAIVTNDFRVGSIFSAYNRLSGDSINFWENDGKLYGYLADCEGHDLASYGQVGSTWLSLKKAMWSYQVGIHKTLADVMAAVNQDYVTLYDRTTIVPSIAFCLDCRQNVLKYCPAGIPSILIQRQGTEFYECQTLQSPLLGYEMDSKFHECHLSLAGITRIVLSSDGLSDLLLTEWQQDPLLISKHDDVSAIYIQIRSDMDVKHGHPYPPMSNLDIGQKKGEFSCNM